jgi:hypothetical protein
MAEEAKKPPMKKLAYELLAKDQIEVIVATIGLII